MSSSAYPTSQLSVPTGSSPPISASPSNVSMRRDALDGLKKTGEDIDPWEICNSHVKKHTEDVCESWRDEVDKLLIFAGLFSGVVTAFAIESYHSMQEDPAEVTALLLKTIVRQLDNMTHPQPDALIDLDPHTEDVTRRTKRINTFWFLSLALSLSTVMAGILCLQWIRAYKRNATVSHREDVALHHMRYEGMKKWQVFKILSTLPLLLIAALLLFFLGFIEVLWEVDKIAAILVCIVVGIAFFFILSTTVLPTFQCLCILAFPQARFAQCPYKSPQAWMFHKLMAFISYLVHCLKSGSPEPTTEPPSKFSGLFKVQSWLEYDSFLRRRRDSQAKNGIQDVGRGLAWTGDTFVQHQEVVEAVCLCLRDLDPRVALEGSLARMDPRRAELARRVRDRNFAPARLVGPTLRRTRSSTTRDRIVVHALEHFAEKIEKRHMSPNLLHQRLDLFLKINGEDGMDESVECPVNCHNVTMIPRDTREQILRCICTMLKGDLDCGTTHTNGAYEIIRSILAENPINTSVPELVSDTLNKFLEWVSKEPSSSSSGEGRSRCPEERLKKAVPFHKLILVCKGGNDRTIIENYRQRLDELIRDRFGGKLDAVEIDMRSLKYPYLTRYILSRGLVLGEGDLAPQGHDVAARDSYIDKCPV